MNQETNFSMAQSYLKAHRLRVTISRMKVFDTLHRVRDRAISRDELLARMNDSGDETSISSMNRALRDLIHAGLVSEMAAQGCPTRFRLKRLADEPRTATVTLQCGTRILELNDPSSYEAVANMIVQRGLPAPHGAITIRVDDDAAHATGRKRARTK
ncbi:transcriptional repressor [Achromobacter aloeverae]